MRVSFANFSVFVPNSNLSRPIISPSYVCVGVHVAEKFSRKNIFLTVTVVYSLLVQKLVEPGGTKLKFPPRPGNIVRILFRFER